jgi:hypothetical protein
MRSGLVCLIAVAGCNSIFGSHDVINSSTDADVRPKDAAPLRFVITGMNYDTTQQPRTTPDSGMASFPILANTDVYAGALDAAMPTKYTLDNTGAFYVPYELGMADYRIVYTPPDGIPFEIQGKMQGATFVVPTLGRANAILAPANAQLSEITPTGGPTQYANLRLFSIGTFAVRVPGAIQASGSSTIWTSNASQVDSIQSMSGGLEQPQAAMGDLLVAVDGAQADPKTMDGYSIGTIPDFSAGFVTPAMTTWKTRADVGVQTLGWTIPLDTSPTAISERLKGVAPNGDWFDDNPGSGQDTLPFIYSGVLPTTKLPNFVESGRGYGSSPLNHWAARGYGGLGMPMFLPMSTSTSSSFDMVHVFNGTDAPAFTPAMFMRFSRSKVVQGVTVTAGIQSIAVTDATNKAQMQFTAGFANQKIQLNNVDILTETNGVTPIPSAPAHMNLDIGIDEHLKTDDCISTIYQFQGTALVPVHRYLLAPNNGSVNSTIVVDKSMFAVGQNYIIGIACHSGLPGVAPALDWSQVASPFTFVEAVSWSLAFTVQ